MENKLNYTSTLCDYSVNGTCILSYQDITHVLSCNGKINIKNIICPMSSINLDEDIKTKIYFAHSMIDYNSEYEMNCMNEINKKYFGIDFIIINPKNIIIPENEKGIRFFQEKTEKYYYPITNKIINNKTSPEMEKYFFSVIKKCDLLIVAKTMNNKISPGVQKEIEYATNKGIKIQYLDIPYPEIKSIENTQNSDDLKKLKEKSIDIENKKGI